MTQLSCLTILEKLGFKYWVTLPKKIADRFEDCRIEYAIRGNQKDDVDSAYLNNINIKRRIDSSFI